MYSKRGGCRAKSGTFMIKGDMYDGCMCDRGHLWWGHVC